MIVSSSSDISVFPLTYSEQQQFSLIFDYNLTPAVLLGFDNKGNIYCVYANAAAKMLMNFTDPKEFVSRFTPLEEHCIDGFSQAAFQGKSALHHVYAQPLKRYLECSVFPFTKGFCGCMFRDITESFQLDQVLESSFESICKMITTGVMIDEFLSGRLLYANKKLLTILGYSTFHDFYDSCRGHVLHLIHPEDADAYTTAINMLRQGKNDFDLVIRIHNQQGQYMYIIVNGKRIFDQKGVPLVVSTCHDITHSMQIVMNRLRLHQEVMEDMSEFFNGTYYVDVDKNTYASVGSVGIRFINENNGVFADFVKKLCRRIHPADRRYVKIFLDLEDFLSNTPSKNGYQQKSIRYRLHSKKGEAMQELMLSTQNHEGNSHLVVMVFRNVTESVNEPINVSHFLKYQINQQWEQYWKTIDLMSSLLEHRSQESGQHVHNIKRYTRCLLECMAQHMPELQVNKTEIEEIVNLSPLHDIGKIGIPDNILSKPGKLNPEEFELMKSHTIIGADITRLIPNFGNDMKKVYSYNICRYHHERYDGKGYPDGLTGNHIPLCAQVVGLADVYEALTSQRVYKDAYSHQEAIQMILRGECGKFNPKLIECLMMVSDQFEAIKQQK